MGIKRRERGLIKENENNTGNTLQKEISVGDTAYPYPLCAEMKRRPYANSKH